MSEVLELENSRLYVEEFCFRGTTSTQSPCSVSILQLFEDMHVRYTALCWLTLRLTPFRGLLGGRALDVGQNSESSNSSAL